MQIVWLGQGGLMLVSERHKLLVDPYMSNSLKKVDKELKRRVRIKKKYFKLKPDVILLTNSHPDHTDEKTLSRFISKRKRKKDRLTVLSCENAFNSLVEARDCKKANHIMFGEGDEWTFENMHIIAVKARTDDRSAFGVIVTDLTDDKKYYIASNTLYNEEIINTLPHNIYAAFIPISGTYGCMNILDAQRFAARLEATYVVPINYGMFDNVDPDKFQCAGRVIPKPFKAIFFDNSQLPSQSKKVFDRKFNEMSARVIQVPVTEERQIEEKATEESKDEKRKKKEEKKVLKKQQRAEKKSKKDRECKQEDSASEGVSPPCIDQAAEELGVVVNSLSESAIDN